jgi:hypothetical protein
MEKLWAMIHALERRIQGIEQRVLRLERQVEQSDSKPIRIRPKDRSPEFDE